MPLLNVRQQNRLNREFQRNRCCASLGAIVLAKTHSSIVTEFGGRNVVVTSCYRPTISRKTAVNETNVTVDREDPPSQGWWLRDQHGDSHSLPLLLLVLRECNIGPVSGGKTGTLPKHVIRVDRKPLHAVAR